MDLTQLRVADYKKHDIASILRSSKAWEFKLEAINEIMNENGVESLVEDGKPIASYVNIGETYEPTVVYDHEKEEFLVTSWGDFYEEWQAENTVSIDVKELAEYLHSLSKTVLDYWDEDSDEDPYLDIRLQVWDDGSYKIRTGDSQYDQDHRGSWGCSSVQPDMSLDDCISVVRDLIDQVEEDFEKNIERVNDDN